jgi:hypothetical protein
VSEAFSQVALGSWRDTCQCRRPALLPFVLGTQSIPSAARQSSHASRARTRAIMHYGSAAVVSSSSPTPSSYLSTKVSSWRPSTAVQLLLVLLVFLSSGGSDHTVLGFVPHSTMQRRPSPTWMQSRRPAALGYRTTTSLAVSVMESTTNDGPWTRSTPRRDSFAGTEHASLHHEALPPLFVLPKHSASRPTQQSMEILSLMEVSLGRVSILVALVLLANAAAAMSLP